MVILSILMTTTEYLYRKQRQNHLFSRAFQKMIACCFMLYVGTCHKPLFLFAVNVTHPSQWTIIKLRTEKRRLLEYVFFNTRCYSGKDRLYPQYGFQILTYCQTIPYSFSPPARVPCFFYHIYLFLC